MKAEDLKFVVQERYGEIAKQSKIKNETSCCGVGSSCCTIDYAVFAESYDKEKGYNPDADLGLGCGIPTQFASIKAGDAVLDLGSGAGNDCFVARAIVGESGKVTGLDFTDAMLEKARRNNEKLGFNNVEFVKGDIEAMPLADNQFDVIVSNCVLNLVPDKAKAFEKYQFAAENGVPGAMFRMGVYYENGMTVEQNFVKAFEWYEKAAQAGYAKASYNLGVLYESGKGTAISYKKAIEQYEVAASAGISEAMNNLGNIWHQGKGVDIDLQQALKWYLKADEAGYMLGTYNLGVLYYFGDAGEKSHQKAFDCFTKAAENGYAQAQFNLAGMYAYGEGVEINMTKAFDWYTLAAENGYVEAWLHLGEIWLNGDGRESNMEKAVECFRKASENENAEASFILSELLKISNPEQSHRFLEKAVSQGSNAAMNNMSVHYLLSNENHQKLKALDWLTILSADNYFVAKLNLAVWSIKSGDFQKAYSILRDQMNKEGEANYLIAYLILTGNVNVPTVTVADLLNHESLSDKPYAHELLKLSYDWERNQSIPLQYYVIDRNENVVKL